MWWVLFSVGSPNDFKQDFTSWLLLVEKRIPLSRNASVVDRVKVNLTNSDDFIRTEGILVLELNVADGLVVSFESDSVVPLRVLATGIADLTLDLSVTNEELAVRVHLAEDVGVVGKLSFNRLDNENAGHGCL